MIIKNGTQKWKNAQKTEKDKNGTMTVSVRVLKKTNHPTCEKDYTWNLGTCPCECKKDFEIGKYFEDCKCMTDFADDLAATYDEIDNTLEIINRSNGTVYCCFSISNRVFTIAGGYDCNVLHET